MTSYEEKLVTAARDGVYHKVIWYLRQGLNVNCVDSDGRTPLHQACLSGSFRIVQALIDQNAQITTYSNSQDTPLHLACMGDDEDEADVSLTRYWRCYDILNLLLLHIGTTNIINHPNVHGDTPLLVACRDKQYDHAKLLLSYGAEIYCTNKDGMTPLHYVSQACNIELVQYMLENYSGPTIFFYIRNKDGYTAKDLVMQQQEKIVNETQKKGNRYTHNNKNKNIDYQVIIRLFHEKRLQLRSQTYNWLLHYLNTWAT